MTIATAFVLQNSRQNILTDTATVPTATPGIVEKSEFTADFEIYTNGTKRIFTDAKYHAQSEEVFLTASSSSTVYVKKYGVTWSDFFNALPFSITKECLITGTKQTFCSTQNKKLKFFINDIENPDALDVQISEGDFLKIVFE